MNYRADIDGIRAIAVSTVILFHFGIGGFSGGFVGVDVFFVLSGYLISSIIFDQLEQKRFSFSNFYFRRIRRLFPVYIVVMLVTLALAYAFMLPREFREFGQSLVASTAYLSNVLFYMEAGYFDTASHLKPLLHTWSLSVEEQFYVVFPFVAWACARFSRKQLFTLFGVFTLASLIAAALYIEHDNSAVFYLYPFRAWEMFLGTLLATRVIPTISSPKWNNLVAIAGLALVILPTLFYTDHTLFPGLSAFVPCFGTILLLHSGSAQNGWVYQLLSTKAPVFIGKLSYSLYLWHWPLYVLLAYIRPEGLSAMEIALVMAATFTASLACYHWVEAPFRHGRVPFSNNKLVVFGMTAVISGIFVFAGYGIHKTNGLPQRLDTKTAAFAEAGGDLFGDLSGCEEEDNTLLPGIGYCKIGQPLQSDSYTLIWGDSHGGAYKRGFTHLIDGTDNHALLAWTGGCPTVFGIDKDESVSSRAIDARCKTRNRAVLELLQNDKRINAVILVGRWSYYINGEGVGVDLHNKIAVWPENSEQLSKEAQADFFVNTFMNTLTTLKSLDVTTFVVEQPPEFEQYIARTLAINLMNGSSNLEESINKLTQQSYSKVEARQGKMQQALARVESENLATVLRTHPYFCSDEICSLMRDDKPLYFDNNHVSSYGAVQISEMFSPVLNYLNTQASAEKN